MDEMKQVSPDVAEQYSAAESVVKAVADTCAQLLIAELQKALSNEDVRSHVKDGVMSVLFAAAFLSFAGREITKESLTNVLKVIHLEPNPKMVDLVLGAGIKNHLIYAYAYYFILVNGLDATESEIADVVGVLGLSANLQTIREVVNLTSQRVIH